MALTEWSSFFCKLVRDYAAAGAGADGIPAAGVLPMVSQDETGALKRPVVVWTCEPEPTGHPRMFVGTVTGALSLAAKADDDAPTTAADWMGAIDARLRDLDAWTTWMTALPEARRTGWIIIDLRVMPGVPEADPEAAMRERRVMVRIKARVLRD